MRTTYTGPVKDRGEDAQGRAKVSREELADFKRKYGADKTLRDLLNADKTGKAPASAAPAGPRRKSMPDPTPMLERMKDRAARGERVASNEEERERAKGRTLAALGAMPGVGAASKLAGAAKSAASKAAPRVESRVGRPVTTKLDDAAAAFSRPQARQASKDTGYTREPSKTTPPQPTRAPKPRDEIIKRQAQMREGRKATEDYARDVMERGAEMGFKKGGMTKGGGCETRGKKARYV
jgi:hypothetical protein